MTGLFFGLIGGLIGGLDTEQIKFKEIANQGVWKSLHNGLKCGLIGGLIGGLLAGLSNEPFFNLSFVLNYGLFFGIMGG